MHRVLDVCQQRVLVRSGVVRTPVADKVETHNSKRRLARSRQDRCKSRKRRRVVQVPVQREHKHIRVLRPVASRGKRLARRERDRNVLGVVKSVLQLFVRCHG
eukprot:Amastigsp_a181134_14.p4 type:complete len:103 gc:universal Amastigsp_a181134_14:391-83(-)